MLYRIVIKSEIYKILYKKLLNHLFELWILLIDQLFGEFREKFVDKWKTRIPPNSLLVKIKISIDYVQGVLNQQVWTVDVSS